MSLGKRNFIVKTIEGQDFVLLNFEKYFLKIFNKSKISIFGFNIYQGSSSSDIIGRWRKDDKLALKCYCSGLESCTKENEAQKCSDEKQSCLSVFDKSNNNKLVARGCKDKVHEKYCSDETKEECIECFSNDCNEVAEYSKYIDCYFCDSSSENGPPCVEKSSDDTKTRKCLNKCMTTLFPRSDEKYPGQDMQRSCLSDKEKDDQAKCTGEQCSACDKPKCNSEIFPKTRLQCFQCDKGNCESKYCPAYLENDKCAITYEEGTRKPLRFLCKSSLEEQVAKDLEKAGQLKTCDDKNCNKPIKCAECKSSDDPKCATEPKDLTSINCDKDGCFTQIDGEATIRGCFSSLKDETKGKCKPDSKTCQQCTTDNCNNEVFPADRRKCYTCSSTDKDDKDCESSPKKSSVCPKYKENEACVTQFTEDKATKRGCLSEIPCDEKDAKKCQVCKDKDNCNNVDIKKLNGAVGIYLTVGAILAMLSHLVL